MKIAYLYYDFLNLYGESGNIKIISNILKYNKIKHEILYLSLDDELEFDKYDLVYIGSGTEDNLLIALKHLSKYKNDIKKYIEDNKFMLITGNSVDLFGQKIMADVTYDGLGIFDYNITRGKRKMAEVYLDGKIVKNKIKKYLKEHLESYRGKVKNVVLGCTHYPLIQDEIQEVLGEVTFFNGAPYLAKHLKEVLEEKDLSNNKGKKGTIQFIDSSNDEQKKKRFFEILEK